MAVAALADDGGAIDAIDVAHRRAGTAVPVRRLRRRGCAAVGRAGRRRRRAAWRSPSRSTRIRRGWPRSASGASSLRNLRRKYGDTLADVIDVPATSRAPGSPSWTATTRPSPARGGARPQRCAAERAPRPPVGAARRAAAPQLARGGRGAPARRWRCRGRRVERRRRRRTIPATTSRSSSPPTRASPPLPLTKVASGGELARTMLALRLVLIEAPGTLRVRRGRRRHRRCRGHGRRRGAGRARPVRTRCSWSPTSRRSPPLADAQVAGVEGGRAVRSPRPRRRAAATTMHAIGEIARMLSGDARRPRRRATTPPSSSARGRRRAASAEGRR